jgi:pyruvate dehydrogenase E1 component
MGPPFAHTVLCDGRRTRPHPHTLALSPTVNRALWESLVISNFGQVGDLESVSRYHGMDTDSIVRAVLGACG